MHASEREKLIVSALSKSGFVSYRDLQTLISASPATIRRDLTRLENEKKIVRVHGGAKSIESDEPARASLKTLAGTPFEKSLTQNMPAKRAIAQKAADICERGEGIIIDGGTTTFQMCDYLAGLDLQVLTNSLHIVNALLAQEGTQILVPSGPIYREQNIILAPSGESSMPDFHASKLFLGAAAVSPRGIFQPDALLVTSQRRLLDQADEVILLVDGSKLSASSGAIVCGLDKIDRIITDETADRRSIKELEATGLVDISVVSI